jgi:hypothetical protein
MKAMNMKLAKARAGNTLSQSSVRTRNVSRWRLFALAMAILAVSNWTYAQGVAADLAKVILEEKVVSLEKANRALEDRVLALENHNRILAANSNHWEKSLQTARTAGRRLSFSMARRVLWNVSRRIAGIPGTSIPYIGAGVSVAMTAVDVQQGCESLKELNIMNREMTLDTEDESKVCGLTVPTKDQVIADVIGNWQSADASALAYTIPGVPSLPPVPAVPSVAEMVRLVTAVVPNLPSRPW